MICLPTRFDLIAFATVATCSARAAARRRKVTTLLVEVEEIRVEKGAQWMTSWKDQASARCLWGCNDHDWPLIFVTCNCKYIRFVLFTLLCCIAQTFMPWETKHTFAISCLTNFSFCRFTRTTFASPLKR